MKQLNTQICIAGGGPAGLLLGLLLARQGIHVIVLEAHKNFDREYRGEVLMPRFLKTMQSVGLRELVESFSHLKLNSFELFLKDKRLAQIDIGGLSKEFPYALWMPQPVLLTGLWEKAKTYPHFQLLFGTTVRHLIKENGQVSGVIAEQDGETFEIRANVIVGADGRFSTVRKEGDFEFEYEGYNFDVVWFTVQQPADYENTVKAFFSSHYRYLVLPKYPNLVQCGLILGKGEFNKWRSQGIETMRRELLDGHPVMHDFARQLKDFESFSVLQARVSFVKQWAKDGCLLIGDAAHTCSPAGAIGVSVAVATAVEAATVLTEACHNNDFSQAQLSKVQARRSTEVKNIQQLQDRFTNIAFSQWPWLSAMITVVFSKTGLLRYFQRKLMLGN